MRKARATKSLLVGVETMRLGRPASAVPWTSWRKLLPSVMRVGAARWPSPLPLLTQLPGAWLREPPLPLQELRLTLMPLRRDLPVQPTQQSYCCRLC